MTKPNKKKAPAKKPAAKAKTKTAPKKVSKPVTAKAPAPKAKVKVEAPRAAAKTVEKHTAKPVKPAKPQAAAAVKPAEKPPVRHAPVRPAAAAPAPAPVAAAPVPPPSRPMMNGPVVATPSAKKLVFKVNELIVYPAHGVGRVTQIEEQEIAGAKLELYIVDFEKEKLRLKVPTGRAEQKGMRRLSDKAQIEQALKVLKGRARIKRTMWSRRAQEYDAKINSGDIISVAEVVRDLYRSERQPEQSYSERQLFEQALDRMAREIAAVKKIDDDQAIKELEDYLLKNAKRPAATGDKAEDDVASEEAA
ncbi:CarD family transcriptional regulator [Aestuariivirga sp.]|uniref:CarD family transcriptional regulator n=1 Tax=Aestuariivirga sp. TaxID=2650926 RepID=UPI0039E4832E